MGTNRQMEKSSTGADLGNVWESNSRERSEEERGYKYRMMQWCNDVSREADRLCVINSLGQKLLTRQVCVLKAACMQLYSGGWGGWGVILIETYITKQRDHRARLHRQTSSSIIALWQGICIQAY